MSAKNEAIVNAIREGLRQILQRCDEIDKTWAQMPAEAHAEFELDPTKLGELPWRPYKEGHRAGWIFTDTNGAEKLVELIKESTNGKVPIGEFEYKLSGNENQFISRNPIETK